MKMAGPCTPAILYYEKMNFSEGLIESQAQPFHLLNVYLLAVRICMRPIPIYDITESVTHVFG